MIPLLLSISLLAQEVLPPARESDLTERHFSHAQCFRSSENAESCEAVFEFFVDDDGAVIYTLVAWVDLNRAYVRTSGRLLRSNNTVCIHLEDFRRGNIVVLDPTVAEERRKSYDAALRVPVGFQCYFTIDREKAFLSIVTNFGSGIEPGTKLKHGVWMDRQNAENTFGL
jgi:hypothetical protein